MKFSPSLLSRALRPRAHNPYYDGPVSDHYDGVRFFNPEGREPGGLPDVLKWKLRERSAPWPTAAPSPFPPARPARAVNDLAVTMVGHSTILVQSGGVNVLTDPVWSDRVSPFSFVGPKRVNPPGIRFADLPPIHAVLISHNHYDHLDLATLALLKAAHDPLFVMPLGNDTIVRASVPEGRFAVLDWDGAAQLPNATVHAERVHHWSARWTRDRRMALWAGFTLETGAGKVFFAGDTGFDGGRPYRRLADKHGGVRLAILPIGAYAPRWFMSPQHQDPREAVAGMRLAGADYALACHWGTFHLTDEALEAPRDELFAALDAAGMDRERFRALRPGEAWDVPAPA